MTNECKHLWGLALAILASVGIASCARGPFPADIVSSKYELGSSRAELLEELKDFQLVDSADRPSTGWGLATPEVHIAVKWAASFEANGEVVVHHVDAFWIPRYDYISTMVPAGVYFDCLYFDANDGLLGFDRVFMD